MQKPLVSILMPTYRRPQYLKNALLSAARQSYERLEIIVRDNASGDETPEVVASLADPRITLLRSRTTVPSVDNWRACLERASGKYCMMLADDDLIDPDYVAVLVELLEGGDGTGAACGANCEIDVEGRLIRRVAAEGTRRMGPMELFMAWRRGSLPLLTACSMLMRTELARVVSASVPDDRFPRGHNADNASMILVALHGNIAFTNRSAYYYRIYSGNSATKDFSNALHLVGDRSLMEFVDRQRRGPRASALSETEWKIFSRELRHLLAGSYLLRAWNNNLRRQGLRENLLDLSIRPLRVFGPSATLWAILRGMMRVLTGRSRRVKVNPTRSS